MKYLFLATISFLSSCDFLTTESDAIVGKFYVISPYVESPAIRRYLFVYVDGSGINNNIIEEDILNIQGNDSLLAVKGIGRDSSTKFYALKHAKGDQPFHLDTLSQSNYSKLLTQIGEKYKFGTTISD